LFYFFKWVEHGDYGAGGPLWVNTHIEAWINISGCMLGAAKGLTAVLSGEMKDTAQLNAFAVYGLERFLSREERAEIFRAMPGISSMMPKGGSAVWGNMTWAPDDRQSPIQNTSFGPFISFKPPINSSLTRANNLTMTDAFSYLMSHSEDWYSDAVQHAYSHGVAHTKAEVERNEDIPRTWLNPLEARLPLAPDLKIYCFYGIGKPTERAYFYKESHNPLNPNINITIDTGFTSANGDVDHGVIFGEGDGTVNLLSTGYVCSKAWKPASEGGIRRYNPAGVNVKVYEMPHEPDRFSPRGGPNTGDHVDILGRSSLNDLILRVAGGKGDEIEENVVSRIREISDKVQIWDRE
jgi:phospholipid:diacylglycerol acyltransferase